MKAIGSTWQSDLSNAHKLENLFSQKLQQQYPTAKLNQAPTDVSFPDWDVELVFSNGNITFELKEDRNVSKTGNVAIEFGRTWMDGTYKPTCISISKADCWVYYFSNTFWLIGAKDLKDLIKLKKYNRIVKGGDGDKAHLYLFKKEVFLSKAVDCFKYLAA